jgi:tetratricopeptide (TPR) repeat protein
MNQTHTKAADWPEAKNLYLRVLRHFYEREEPEKAVPLALSLLRLLDRLDPAATTLPGNEYRAVIAELDNDLQAAIRYRETVIAMLDGLATKHRLNQAGLSASDYSDQLDLLAILYRRSGRLQDAKAAIEKSASLCREANVKFDGADVQKDIDQALRNAARVLNKRRLTAGS